MHPGLPVEDPHLARLQSMVMIQSLIPDGMVYDSRREQWYYEGEYLTSDEAGEAARAVGSEYCNSVERTQPPPAGAIFGLDPCCCCEDLMAVVEFGTESSERDRDQQISSWVRTHRLPWSRLHI